jgi:leader peptidase (prepilin peptidase) / N-methyltransferase
VYYGPDWLLPLLAAPFVGSFLGLLSSRLPNGLPYVMSRSACPHCTQQLAPRDMVPVLSWLISGGRCRYCGVPLDMFYPAVEVAAIVPVLMAATIMSGWLLWVTCLLGWVLLVLALIDFRHFILPDALIFPLIATGLVVAYFIHAGSLIDHAIGALIGFTSFTMIGILYRRVRGRHGLGLGDAKLLAAAGAWVSWSGLASVVLISAASALLVTLVSAAIHKNLTPDRRIPFGPYLGLGIWMVWLYGAFTPVV